MAVEKVASKIWIILIKRTDYRRVTKEVSVQENCTVLKLIEESCKAFKFKTDEILLISNNFVLSAEDLERSKKKLSEFKISDNCTVDLHIKRLPLKSLPGLITITIDPKQPDMITRDDEHPRAIMPCGHPIGSESMATFCFTQLKDGKTKFFCQYYKDGESEPCGAEWPFNLVRHVGCFVRSELEEIESKLASLAMENAGGAQECPRCSNWVVRGSVLHNRSVCPMCTRKDGKMFEFCWQCLGPWKGRRDCGNPNCTLKDPRIEILASCSDKMIEYKMAPSIRGCPSCGMLIHHKDKCKHMKCTRCGKGFCFFCLGPVVNEDWKCEADFGNCKVEPRQTWLPNGINDGFEDLKDRRSREGMLGDYDSDNGSDRDWSRD